MISKKVLTLKNHNTLHILNANLKGLILSGQCFSLTKLFKASPSTYCSAAVPNLSVDGQPYSCCIIGEDAFFLCFSVRPTSYPAHSLYPFRQSVYPHLFCLPVSFSGQGTLFVHFIHLLPEPEQRQQHIPLSSSARTCLPAYGLNSIPG